MRPSDIKRASGISVSALVIGFPIFLILVLAEFITKNGLWTFVVVGCLCLVALKIVAYKKRKRVLFAKYDNNEIVSKILKREIWQGQTQEQLLESLGKPHQVDHKLLKRTKREVWKYHLRGKNRYGLRVVLDNEIVAGWDKKSR